SLSVTISPPGLGVPSLVASRYKVPLATFQAVPTVLDPSACHPSVDTPSQSNCHPAAFCSGVNVLCTTSGACVGDGVSSLGSGVVVGAWATGAGCSAVVGVPVLVRGAQEYTAMADNTIAAPVFIFFIFLKLNILKSSAKPIL